MTSEEPVRYERQGAVSIITLNRPHRRNAQNTAMTVALDDAFTTFAQDDSAAVAVLAAEGDHFSAGHDLSPDADYDQSLRRRGMWWDHVGKPAAESWMSYEEEYYLGMCRRWREIPKPTIAAVQGACIAGGLILAWSCDLLIAADDAFFSDPVVRANMPGVEFFYHPWQMGPRFAKEFLFLGERIAAERALSLGMVNRVVPRAALMEQTMDMAQRIALMPRFGLALAKQSVHQTEEAMGLRTAVDAAFALHQLGHAHNQAAYGSPMMVGKEGLRDPGRAEPGQHA